MTSATPRSATSAKRRSGAGSNATPSPRDLRAAVHAADFLRFEGNAQTLRLVARLQILADWHGLNLTAGTLAVARKYVAPAHEADRAAEDHARTKPGYFASEAELMARVAEVTGCAGVRHPVTFLVEAADDIAYSMIDLEDGVKKGAVDWATLRTELPDAAVADRDRVRDLLDRAAARVAESPLRLRGRAHDEACVQALRTPVIGATMDAAVTAFAAQYEAIMSGSYPGELVKDGPAAGLVKACKTLGRRYVYCAEDVLRVEVMGRRVIHDLMDLFWEAARAFEPGWIDADGRLRTTAPAAKIYALLSPNYRAVFERALAAGDLPETYCRFQLVTDNIAGMTDTYACTLHRRLTNL